MWSKNLDPLSIMPEMLTGNPNNTRDTPLVPKGTVADVSLYVHIYIYIYVYIYIQTLELGYICIVTHFRVIPWVAICCLTILMVWEAAGLKTLRELYVAYCLVEAFEMKKVEVLNVLIACTPAKNGQTL